jgi:hypothetical protein
VALKRLTPTIKNLGYLRLWQDDLAEIIAFVQRLENVKITLVADKIYELLDGEADLPSLPAKLGRRLRLFTITIKAAQSVNLGTEDGLPDNQPSDGKEILAVRLARNGCQIEAADPDIQTRDVINLIEEKARKCRRAPLWFPRPWLVGPPANAAEVWGTAIVTVCATYLFLAGISMYSYFNGQPQQQVIPWPGSIAAGIPVAVVLLGFIVIAARTRTILFTQTRASAPTFWQANRTAITINVVTNVVVAGIFLLIGLVIAHH